MSFFRFVLCKRFCLSTPFVILANNNTDRDVRRAFIPYAPLYPTFEERLSQFRQEGHAELFQRGAEQVVQNVGLFDTGRGRSSEERSSDLIVSLPEDVVTPGPSEALVYEEQAYSPCADNIVSELCEHGRETKTNHNNPRHHRPTPPRCRTRNHRRENLLFDLWNGKAE